MSSLHIAVEIQDNNQVLTQLAAADSNINIRNKVGRTSLHLAAKSGNLDYLKILLDAGCDREIKDKFGMKAVDAARAKNHKKCVEFLLSYKPQRRSPGTPEDENNSLEKQPYKSRKLLFRFDKDLKSEKSEEKANDESVCLVLPEILVCEMNQENVIEKARVLVEELPRVTQLQICAITYEQVIHIKNSVKQQDVCENIRKNDAELANDFVISSAKNDVEDGPQEKIKQVEKRDKNVDGDTCGRNGILTTKFLQETTAEDIAASSEFDVRRTNHKPSYKSVPLLSVRLNKCGENGSSIHSSVESSGNFEDPAENAPEMPLQTIKLDNNFPDKKYFATALHKTARTAINSAQLYKLLTRILEPEHNREFRVDKKINSAELSRCKEECLVLLGLVPVSLFSVKLKEEDFLRPWMFNGTITNGWSMNGFTLTNHGLERRKIISKVLKGLKLSMMNGAILNCSNNQSCNLENERELRQNVASNGGTEKQTPHLCEDENLLEIFIKACCTIKSHPSDSYRILEEFCEKISLKDRAELNGLTKKIFSCCNLSNCGVKSEVNAIDIRNCLEVLDHVVRHEKCPVYFVSSVLDMIMAHRGFMNLVLESRPCFVEFVLKRTISCEEKMWDEERIAKIFLLLCELLEDEVGSLCSFVDVFLGHALSRPDINNMLLSSFILVRMGLLKSEFRVRIVESLKGPFIALKHVFAQDYFPWSLAGLFVSFLAKPSARLGQVRDLHNQTLKSALLKEILPDPKDKNANVLGKGLKRICDVLAHGEYWETADYCCEALFKKVLEPTKYREAELEQSILVYFGLIKSEDKLETIKNVGTGLKLLQHVANGNHIPQSIALTLSVFLKKEKKRLESCKDDLECLINILQNCT